MSWYSIPFALSKAKNPKILAPLQVSPYGLVLPMAVDGLAMAPAASKSCKSTGGRENYWKPHGGHYQRSNARGLPSTFMIQGSSATPAPNQPRTRGLRESLWRLMIHEGSGANRKYGSPDCAVPGATNRYHDSGFTLRYSGSIVAFACLPKPITSVGPTGFSSAHQIDTACSCRFRPDTI